MPIIDTHCHLYSKSFDADRPNAIDRAAEAGLTHILLPAIDRESHQNLLALAAEKHPRIKILPMMGVHPCSIKEDWEEELNLAYDLLTQPDAGMVAVGEIGLDYHWDLTHQAQQIEAYRIQLGWAAELGLPVAIHSRKSTADCIRYLKPWAGKIKGVFHCFSGSLEEAQEITALGFYLGIGGVATYHNTNLREILPKIGAEWIVLETDAPYLPPVPFRGKRNEPAYVKRVAEVLADAFQMNQESFSNLTTQNAKSLFGLSD